MSEQIKRMPLAKFGAEDLEEKMESVFGVVVADPQQTLAMPVDLIDQRPEFALLAYVDLVHADGLDSGKIAVLDSIFHDPLHGSIHVGPSHAEASGDLGPREQTCPLGKEKTDNTHYLLLTNLYPHAEIAPVDLSAWKLPPGSLITVEEVSSKHHGDVRAALALPTDRQLELPVSGSSVTLLSARPVHSGKPSATLPVATEAQLGVLTAPALPTAHRPKRVLLALRANPVVPGAALQVRAGAGDALLADVLGQFVPTADATERVVDITRYVLAHPDTPLVFQVVAEGSAASLPGQAPEPATVHSAELRIFGPR